MEIDISKISYGKHFNPRERLDREYVRSLAASLRTDVGVIKPITLRHGDYELIDGLHRIEAAKLAGLRKIPCEFKDLKDREAREFALIANAFGKRLTALEIGKAADFLLSDVKRREGRLGAEEELAKKLGLVGDTLRDYMASYKNISKEAQPQIAAALADKKITTHHLHDIRKLPERKQVAIAKKIEAGRDPSRIDRLVRGFAASHEEKLAVPAPAPSPIITPLVAKKPMFHPVPIVKLDLEGIIKNIDGDTIEVEEDGASFNFTQELTEGLKTLHKKAHVGDHVAFELVLKAQIPPKNSEAMKAAPKAL